MNWAPKKGKNWRFGYLFVTIILLFSIYGLRIYVTKQNDTKHIYTGFQKTINETEHEVKNAVDLLSIKFDTNSITGTFWKTGLQNRKSRKNNKISFFVFKQDSLIFWSDNKVILPADFIRKCARSNFVLKLKSGWYGFHYRKSGSFLFLGSYLIKNEYPFQNEYIKNGFSNRFNFPEIVGLTKEPGQYPIRSDDGAYLFSLNFCQDIQSTTAVSYLHKDYEPQGTSPLLFFALFMLTALCLMRFIFFFYTGLNWFTNHKHLFIIVFFTNVLILRVIQFYIRFPAELYNSELFGPSWYSSSVILPSLGDFTINSILVFVMALVFFKNCSFKPLTYRNRLQRRIIGNSFILFIFLFFFQTVGYLITDLVINSSLSLNLQNISGLTLESGYGLIIVSAILFSFWLISARVFNDIFPVTEQKNSLMLSVAIAIVLNGLFFWVFKWKMNYMVILFFIIYFAVFWYIKTRKQMLFSVQTLLFFLCFNAVFATFILNLANQQKEKEKLNLLAVTLATRRNPVTEVLYEQLERKLQGDSILKRNFQPLVYGIRLSPDSLIAYLKRQYFKDYWQKYTIQITLCDAMKDLRIQPQGYLINCNTYFSGVIKNYGEETILPNLIFLDYGFGKDYYLAILTESNFGITGTGQQTIFIELNQKNDYPDPGYPGLLMDNTRMDLPSLSDYSYGLFQNGRLVHAVGDYNYNIKLDQYKTFSKIIPSFSEDQMTHYQYHVNNTTMLLISKKEDIFLTQITPFSYLFILFALLSLLVTGILNFSKKLNFAPYNLRNRLQISLIGILIVALFAIGIVQIINIIDISSKKNTDNLREKAYSVMVEVQHKYNAAREIRDIAKNELEDFLIKLSNVFFTDINFYDIHGGLISSSRPQIFEEGLVSERMNPEAYKKLIIDNKSSVIQHESIGSMIFSSAYLPFYNEQNNLLGYVNLPYFSRQDELKKEISSFLVTFINIYILLILFGVLISVLISNYITAPLALLAEKISRLRLGRINEKIFWNQRDEIGQLVTEYNRMVDELGRSAEIFAQSERENAWREMAKQVAHEIKNPLTPMKLGAQYLQKAWNDKAPDWDQRLARFTAILVEQIDTLSAIASDFSNFAKMPAVVAEQVDLEEVVGFVLFLYQDTSAIGYEFQPGADIPTVLADRSQLIRVFTNLLNNAVQAIGDRKEGMIRIQLSKEKQYVIVEISDNGEGISVSGAEKIFQPDFTTKTGGMGLGLAIVKGIVEGMNGEISFTSEEQKGTTFIIKIPVYAGCILQESD